MADPESLQVDARILILVNGCSHLGNHLLLHLFNFLRRVVLRVHQDLRLCAFKVHMSVCNWVLWMMPSRVRLRANGLRAGMVFKTVRFTGPGIWLCAYKQLMSVRSCV